MRFTKWKAVGIAVLAAGFACINGGAAQAAVETAGVDFDAGCVVNASITPPAPNSFGGSANARCTVSLTDTSPDGLDIQSWSVGSGSGGKVSATWTVKQTTGIPAPGNTIPPATSSYKLPSKNFVGGTYYAMFQNEDKETNALIDDCTRGPLLGIDGLPVVGGPRVYDTHGSWKDGYHDFLAYSIRYDGQKWVHVAQVGEYDPRPLGGFNSREVAINDGSGWAAVPGTGVTASASLSGGVISLSATGVVHKQGWTCTEGETRSFLWESGDSMINAKALTTADEVVTLPVTIPLSALCQPTDDIVCVSNITTVGGFEFFVDTTAGDSTAGLLDTNTTGIAYSGGAIGPTGAIGVIDTLGPGPRCPTPTYGGALPQNPFFIVDQPCHIDDDTVARGSFLPEFWDTMGSFTV